MQATRISRDPVTAWHSDTNIAPRCRYWQGLYWFQELQSPTVAGPQTQTCPQQHPDPDNTMAPGDSTGHSYQLGLSVNTVLRHQHGHRLWPRPWVAIWLLMALQTRDINSHSDNDRTMDLDMVLGSSLGQDVTMAPRSNAGHQDGHDPCGTMALRQQYGPRWPSIP